MPRLWPSSCAATPNVSQPVPRWQTLSCPLHVGSPTFAKHPDPCESNTYIAGHVEHVFLDSLPTATFLKPRHGIRFLKCWTASKKAFFAEALKVRDKQYGMFILSFQAVGVKKRRPWLLPARTLRRQLSHLKVAAYPLAPLLDAQHRFPLAKCRVH